MVGVALRLRAGGHLLAGVLHEAGLLLLFGAHLVDRRERDLLLGELRRHVVVGEAGVAGEHHADRQEQAGEQYPAGAEQDIEGSASHVVSIAALPHRPAEDQ